MSPSWIMKAAIASIFTVVLILSPFSALVLDPHQAVAETADCAVTGSTIELKYDDGIPYGQMYTHQLAGCDQCQTFQGVLFSLPEGVSSSVLRKVRFYAGGGKASVRIHIIDTAYNLLIPKITYGVTEEKWHEIPLPDVTVPNKFWVFVEATSLKVVPFYDARKTGPSYNGKIPESRVSESWKQVQGDLLIRA